MRSRPMRVGMIDSLNWTHESDFSITSPELITYCNEKGNVTNLPLVQFVATYEELEKLFYPVVYGVNKDGEIVFKSSYQEFHDKENALQFARDKVRLNGWTFEIGREIDQIAS